MSADSGGLAWLNLLGLLLVLTGLRTDTGWLLWAAVIVLFMLNLVVAATTEHNLWRLTE